MRHIISTIVRLTIIACLLLQLTAAFAATGNFSPSPSPLAKAATTRFPTSAAKPAVHAVTRMRPYTLTSPTKEAHRPRAVSSAKAMRV